MESILALLAGILAWACRLGKIGAFVKNPEKSWPLPECQGPLRIHPRDAVPSNMVWNAGGGCLWAATAGILKNYPLLTHFLKPNCFKKSQIITFTFLLSFVHRINQLGCIGLCGFFIGLQISLPKGGVHHRTLTPAQAPSPNRQDITSNVPEFPLALGRSFCKPTFWQGIIPSTAGHQPAQTECAGVLS